jgi:quinoprotein dehydrogenase-associated probable ABC transporter substrate-binding protein
MNPVKRKSYRSIIIACSATLAAAITTASGEESGSGAFRVCADPNNLPFSNRARAGFEDKLAEIIAADLSRPLEYVWHPQRRAFIRNTLKAGMCDAVMGVPAELGTITASRPYYRSTYVFVYRPDHGLDGLSSLRDHRLKDVSIGVQLIGDDGYNTPPAHALSAQGIVDNLVGYTIYGDYREPNPPARIVEAVAAGAVDVAAVWGPLAGYFAPREIVPLTLAPITDMAEYKPLLFQYDIAVGVRKGDEALKTRIDAALDRHRLEIKHLLRSYGVPLVAEDGTVARN